MLRHYTLMHHESCQSRICDSIKVLCCLLALLFSAQTLASEKDPFTITLAQLEYIDFETNKVKVLHHKDDLTGILLPSGYNHVFVEMENDPTIQYFYKVTTKSGVYDWKRTSHDFNIIAMSRGGHQICIRGMRNGVYSSNMVQFEIFVTTPFYLRWWFISLIIIVVVGVFYLFLVLEAKLLKERRDRNLQVSNLEAKAYRAQMNPHFIFNALNGMQSAMILGGEEEFNKYITSFSKLLRNTIEMSSVDKISVADEVAYITNYVNLQGHRLEQKIDLEFNIDPEIDQNEVYLPCMMLQPIVENSIVHGIVPKRGKGKIKIDLLREDEMLKISVTDNGIGRAAAAKQKEKYAKHKSFATQIMRDRINIFNYYNDRKLTFSIEDLYHEDGSPAGTKDILYVPLDLKTRHK